MTRKCQMLARNHDLHQKEVYGGPGKHPCKEEMPGVWQTCPLADYLNDRIDRMEGWGNGVWDRNPDSLF